MRCDICSVTNVEPEHTISEKHLRNKVLYEYSVNRKQFAGNRKGAVVTCDITTSFVNISECADARIKVSAKPNEQIRFDFIISNETKRDIMNVNFIEIPPNHLNFVMNDHGLVLGSTPMILKPKRLFPFQVYVLFMSAHIGQYVMPVIFSFSKLDSNENIVIVRDMVVYVEHKQALHLKVISPYARKEVVAPEIVRTTAVRRDADDLFHIPKNYKPVYASGLRVKRDSPENLKSLAADIKDIFETGITKDNYIRFFHNLLWYEETIIRLNLKNYNMSGVVLVQHAGDNLGLFVPGLGEKRPSLMVGDMLHVKPQKSEIIFEAVISDISQNYINIGGLQENFWSYYSHGARFDIRFFLSRLPLERMHLAVDGMFTDVHRARAFPLENMRLPKITSIKNYYNLLVEANPEQRLAVERIAAGAAGAAPYLLHGPPGTGKTVTVVEAVLQLVNKNPRNRIMVCTDSNMAADHVASVLIKYSHMFHSHRFLLRASSKYRVWETLPECLHRYSNGTSYFDFEPVSINDFLSYRIVITTLSHAAKFSRQFQVRGQRRPITHLFIDEAAQASEPSCMIPVVGLLEPQGALVLAGDPLQLGPVIISNGARTRGLGLSLMERLKLYCPLYSDERNDPNYMVMLLNNFRSHEDILHLPNTLFYKGQLRAFARGDEITTVDILGDKIGSRAIVFHGLLSKEQRMGKSPSYYNDMEIEMVQVYIMALLDKHKVRPEDIGVVTPYIRQVYKIKTWLQKNRLGKLEVGTVEAFQGKEKRVIVISTVRAHCNLLDHDARFQLGFLVDDKRFNVALTRAKAKVIVIGNPLCLQRDAKWRAYMQRCRALGSYRGCDAAALRGDLTQRLVLQRLAPALRDLRLEDKARKARA